MINTTSERHGQETSSFVGILVVMSSYNFVRSLGEHEKGFITTEPGSSKYQEQTGKPHKQWAPINKDLTAMERWLSHFE